MKGGRTVIVISKRRSGGGLTLLVLIDHVVEGGLVDLYVAALGRPILPTQFLVLNKQGSRKINERKRRG